MLTVLYEQPLRPRFDRASFPERASKRQAQQLMSSSKSRLCWAAAATGLLKHDHMAGALMELRLSSIPLDRAARSVNQLAPPAVSSLRAPTQPARCIASPAVPGVASRVMAEPKSSISSQVDFLLLVGKLKTTKRAGWVQRGMPDCESVSDHMHRMAIMSLMLQQHGINPMRCLQLSVVHDLAEAIVGDITPQDGISKVDKNRMETDAINQMTSLLGKQAAGDDIRSLWQEYEDCSTPEAALVKDYDKLEMILQALEYETTRGAQLEEFFQAVKDKFKTQIGKQIAADIVSRRQPHSS